MRFCSVSAAVVSYQGLLIKQSRLRLPSRLGYELSRPNKCTPFAQSVMVITDLPIETLEHIVAALDSPTDLQNLAAVCTQLRSIVEPYHTQFRPRPADLASLENIC